MKIGIIGCGWLGIKIADYLIPNNQIYATTTSQDKIEKLVKRGFNSNVISFSDCVIERNISWDKFKELDVIIITIPYSTRNTIDSLKVKFNNLCYFIGPFEKQIFLMSSIGIYPQMEIDIDEFTLNETELNQNILIVENLMKNQYPQINILRLGGLMGDDRIFSNYKIPISNQIVNHVHYEDVNCIIKKMIDLNIHSKTYNVVAPSHPTKAEVINHQKGEKTPIMTTEPYGRKILSNKMIYDLDYKFIHSDPKTFV